MRRRRRNIYGYRNPVGTMTVIDSDIGAIT